MWNQEMQHLREVIIVQSCSWIVLRLYDDNEDNDDKDVNTHKPINSNPMMMMAMMMIINLSTTRCPTQRRPPCPSSQPRTRPVEGSAALGLCLLNNYNIDVDVVVLSKLSSSSIFFCWAGTWRNDNALMCSSCFWEGHSGARLCNNHDDVDHEDYDYDDGEENG